jgi:hypothetical protein
MTEKLKFNVDLANPADIKAKISEAEEIFSSKQAAARRAREEADRWRELVDSLKRLAGGTDPKGRPRVIVRRSPMQDAVVRVVEEEDRAMRPIEVTQRLKEQGRKVASNAAVNTALYAAVEAGRLRRPGERQYAPLKRKAVKKAKKPPRKASS